MRVLLLAIWLAVAPLSAVPVISRHSLEALAAADLLVVGRVTRIDVGVEVSPPEGRRWQHPVFEHAAEVELLRFHAAETARAEELASQRSVRIAYRGEYPLGQGGVLPGPLWPEIREGDVNLFALKQTDGGAYRLWSDDGSGAVPPAFDALLSPSPVSGSLDFVEREIANALGSGEPAVAYAAAQYLRDAIPSKHDSADERLHGLFRRLEEVLNGDSGRAAEAAGAMLAAKTRFPRSISDLIADRYPSSAEFEPIDRLTGWTLVHIPAGEREGLLIETLLRNLRVYSRGAATPLKQLARHPALEAPLAAAISERSPGILFVLEALIGEGRADLVSPALAVVREHIEAPGQPDMDWQTASRLLWYRGSAEDLEQFMILALRAQREDERLYYELWQAAGYYEGATRRTYLRFVAIYLADQRPASGDVRYCDLALGALLRHRLDRFGLESDSRMDEIPRSDRDAAIQRAAQWLSQRLGPSSSLQ